MTCNYIVKRKCNWRESESSMPKTERLEAVAKGRQASVADDCSGVAAYAPVAKRPHARIPSILDIGAHLLLQFSALHLTGPKACRRARELESLAFVLSREEGIRVLEKEPCTRFVASNHKCKQQESDHNQHHISTWLKEPCLRHSC